MSKAGLLAAFQGQDNWDAIRKERQRELQLTAMNAELAKQAFKEKQQAAADMRDYLSFVGKIKVLDPAIKSINGLNDKLMAPIREDILKHGGDVEKWLAEGGAIKLQNYKNELLNSPEVAKGIMSAANYNRYIADSQLGLVPRGNPSADLNAYMAETTDVFPYAGGYQQPDLTNARKYFHENRGKNKYVPQKVDNATLRQYVVTEAKKQGLSMNDAEHFADRTLDEYDKMIKGGGQPYMFGSDNYSYNKAWADEHATELSMRYVVDAVKSLKDPNSKVWNPLPDLPGTTVDKGLGISIPDPSNPQANPVQQADVLGGWDLGEKTVHVAKGRQVLDKDNKPVTLGADSYVTIKDKLLPFIKKDGKVYIQSVAQQMAGEPPVELTDGSIDRLFAGAPKNQNTFKIIAALRKTLAESKNLDQTGRPDLGVKKETKFKGVPQGGF